MASKTTGFQPPSRSYLLLKKCIVLLASGVLPVATTLAQERQVLTRVAWVHTCPSEPKDEKGQELYKTAAVALIGAAIAPKLIEGAVDLAAEALKAAGQTKTMTSMARVSGDFYKLSQDADVLSLANCLVVVRGEFDPAVKTTHDQVKKVKGWENGFKSVNFYFEAKSVRLKGLEFFQLSPYRLEVHKFDHWRLFGKGRRDYNVAITLTTPGSAVPFGSAQMNFKDIKVGELLKSNDWRLDEAKTLPIPFPPETGDLKKAKEQQEALISPYLLALSLLVPPGPSGIKSAPSVYDRQSVRDAADNYCMEIRSRNAFRSRDKKLLDERCDYTLESLRKKFELELKAADRSDERVKWASDVCAYVPENRGEKTSARCTNQKPNNALNSKTFTYFTTELVLNEASDGSKIALYLGKVLSDSKDDVSSVLKSYLPKSDETRSAERATARAASESAAVADLEVELAQAVLADALLPEEPDLPTVTSARIALLKAKISANEAHRKAGSPIPFPKLSSF